ncbi:MAG: hypothetical protein IKJ67_00560 [Bacteroidales bacterium]|nr:hypothetical protein [Bacteroidales bacterium]
MIKKIHQKIKQKDKLKSFFVCVILTIVVWFVQTMSDIYVYEKAYNVTFVGYNDKMYTYIDADSTISVSVKSTGFQYLSTLWRNSGEIIIDVSAIVPYESNGNIVYPFSLRDNKEIVKKQIPFLKQKETQILSDTARLILTKLTQKKVRIVLNDVDFLFKPQFGLYGNPKLQPDSIDVYGSKKELENIVEIKTKTKMIENISKTNFYDLELQKPTNVNLSADVVKIHIPVERYTEKRLIMPINFQTEDSTMQVRLYPENVELILDVAMKDYKKIMPEMFDITLQYDKKMPQSLLNVTVEKYPCNIKIKEIKPKQVQYVIIK